MRDTIKSLKNRIKELKTTLADEIIHRQGQRESYESDLKFQKARRDEAIKQVNEMSESYSELNKKYTFVETKRSLVKRVIGDIQMNLYHAEYYFRSNTEEHHKQKAIEYLKKALEQLAPFKDTPEELVARWFKHHEMDNIYDANLSDALIKLIKDQRR